MNIPVHLALIMDGNGRWAERRGLPRSSGHAEGCRAAVRIIDAALSRGIKYLTLYCFSTENWKRPGGEVSCLMGLLSSRLKEAVPEARKKGIKILHLGSEERLPADVVTALREAEKETAEADAMTLQLAINYGGHDEIDRAVRKAVAAGEKTFGEETISRYLDNPSVPAPDFIARSAGEQRLSGFLLYQSSYAEIGFYDKLWPDWDESMIDAIIMDFSRRERKFGGLR